jgi:hypothetical protein
MSSSNNAIPIFWTPPKLQDGTPSSFTDPNYIPLIKRYFGDVGGSSLYQINSQYYEISSGTKLYIRNAVDQKLQAIVDTSPYPTAGSDCQNTGPDCMAEFQIAAEAQKFNSDIAANRYDSEFFIFTLPNESSCLHSSSCFAASNAKSAIDFNICAYHSFELGRVFADMPYGASPSGLPNSTGSPQSCTGLSSFPNDPAADIEISQISHEQIETTTDPLQSGWTSAKGEIGDLCAYNYGSRSLDGGLANQQWNGNFYVVQQEWSNQNGGCVKGMLVPRPGGDSFARETDPGGLQIGNDWVGSTTDPPEVAYSNGVVYLRGAVSSPFTTFFHDAFVLPPDLAPPTTVQVLAHFCHGSTGAVVIDQTGVANVDPNSPTAVSDAKCLTSLDGISFALSSTAALGLRNGWTTASGAANASVSLSNGVVHLKGAISGGNTAEAFTLPAPFRPSATSVFVPAGVCSLAAARVDILPTGQVLVDPFNSTTKCLTSLDGVSFAIAAPTKLSLGSGWSGGPSSTAQPAAMSDNGIVHLQGAIAHGSNGTQPFTLPPDLSPTTTITVVVDMCLASTGELEIGTDGDVLVRADSIPADASCFTSLDGVSFASKDAFQLLTLKSGWQAYPFFSPPAVGVDVVNGIVTLKGAVRDPTHQSNLTILTLPPLYRPTAELYIPVDTGQGSAASRLFIKPDGTVTLQAASIVDGESFTSLDGVSFFSGTGAALTLINGWGPYSSITNSPAVIVTSPGTDQAVVHFKGAMKTSGTNVEPFTLPPSLNRSGPLATMEVLVDTFNAGTASLVLNLSGFPGGTVGMSWSAGSPTAFTSLEGVSYALGGPSMQPLTLENGWLPAGNSYLPAGESINGIVHLQGAISSGAGPAAFTLPAGLAPPTTIDVPVVMCNGTSGALKISPNGSVNVITTSTFSNATCLTSLEGVSYDT